MHFAPSEHLPGSSYIKDVFRSVGTFGALDVHQTFLRNEFKFVSPFYQQNVPPEQKATPTILVMAKAINMFSLTRVLRPGLMNEEELALAMSNL